MAATTVSDDSTLKARGLADIKPILHYILCLSSSRERNGLRSGPPGERESDSAGDMAIGGEVAEIEPLSKGLYASSIS